MSFESPTKVRPSLRILSIDDLNPDYLAKLKEKIPILKNKLLLQLILNYSVELANNDPDIDSNLQIINKLIYFLSLQSEIPENLDNSTFSLNRPSNSNFESYTYLNETNEKYVKTHPLNAAALIEAIIQFTLYYYDSSICPQLVIMNINNIPLSLENPSNNIRKRFKQKMNFYDEKNYISLGKHLTNLFKSELSDVEKLIIFKDILIKIANKVKIMQQYGFIHGDFHSGNIYLDLAENIYFIDFGFSCIKLPLNNGSLTDFLLCVPVPSYTGLKNTKLRFPYSEEIRKIDLFHLMENINTLDIDNAFFKKIVEVIRQNYLNEEINALHAPRHDFTCSFKLNLINNFFYPEEFISYFERLNISEVEENNNNSMNNNNNNMNSNNNANPGFKKKKILFGNND
jgi:hypothetical protein